MVEVQSTNEESQLNVVGLQHSAITPIFVGVHCIPKPAGHEPTIPSQQSIPELLTQLGQTPSPPLDELELEDEEEVEVQTIEESLKVNSTAPVFGFLLAQNNVSEKHPTSPEVQDNPESGLQAKSPSTHAQHPPEELLDDVVVEVQTAFGIPSERPHIPFASQHSRTFPEHIENTPGEAQIGIAPLQQSLLPLSQYDASGFS